MSGSAKVIALQTHFKICQSRHILLKIREQGCDVMLTLEASPQELLHEFEH